MDSNFYIDNFERMLREKSDEFRMYPTRRVWHSIYNNVYPGRKFPSAIISILFITMLPLIGMFNTKTLTTIIATNTTFNIKPIVKNLSVSVPAKTMANTAASINTTGLNKTVSLNSDAVVTTTTTVEKRNAPQIIIGQHLNTLSLNTTVLKTTIAFANKPDIKASTTPSVLEDGRNVSVFNDNVVEKNIAAANYALQNTSSTQKWTDKLALQIYAAPSIIYGVSAGPQASNISNQGLANNIINQNVGLEAGTAMQYSLSAILKLKAGLQFNYASYDIAANQNGHAPVVANDPAAVTNAYLLARASDFSSTNTAATLHNEMYQFSLPVGLELKLLKHNNFQWNAGATIQPTYIAGGDAYLLSSNSHVDESALVNRWNLNAGFETFITYKVNNITWQLGPQFRYQFSSTYGKAYAGMDEKLAIFGVKIGVVKVLH